MKLLRRIDEWLREPAGFELTWTLHRSRCSCGWTGPWRLFWAVAWLDYYLLHRNNRDLACRHRLVFLA